MGKIILGKVLIEVWQPNLGLGLTTSSHITYIKPNQNMILKSLRGYLSIISKTYNPY